MIEQQKVYIPVAVIGSGKSTLAKEMTSTNPSLVIVSDDALREMLYGRYTYKPPYEAMIFKLVLSITKQALTHGCDVYVDQPNLFAFARGNLIRSLNMVFQDLYFEAIYFKPNIGNLENRLKEPRGCSKKIWAEAYKEQVRMISIPKEDEGFSLVRHYSYPQKTAAVTYYSMQVEYCVKNDLPILIPSEEICPKCRRSIWDGYGGIACCKHITACPHCHKSFCD